MNLQQAVLVGFVVQHAVLFGMKFVLRCNLAVFSLPATCLVAL